MLEELLHSVVHNCWLINGVTEHDAWHVQHYEEKLLFSTFIMTMWVKPSTMYNTLHL